MIRLSPVHTVTENGDCRRKVHATVAENGEKTATVALFCDSRRFRPQIVAEIGDSVDRLLGAAGGQTVSSKAKL